MNQTNKSTKFSDFTFLLSQSGNIKRELIISAKIHGEEYEKIIQICDFNGQQLVPGGLYFKKREYLWFVHQIHKKDYSLYKTKSSKIYFKVFDDQVSVYQETPTKSNIFMLKMSEMKKLYEHRNTIIKNFNEFGNSPNVSPIKEVKESTNNDNTEDIQGGLEKMEIDEPKWPLTENIASTFNIQFKRFKSDGVDEGDIHNYYDEKIDWFGD